MGVGGQHHTRPGGAKSADDIGGVLDQAGVDSGQIGRRRIAADRFEKQSKSSAADEQPQGAEDRTAKNEPGRNQSDMSDAQALQERTGEARVGPAIEQVDHQPDASPADHQDQGGDDRLDVENGDQEPVPQPAQDAHREREHKNDEVRIASVNPPSDDRADDGDDRSDRKIDAFRSDHHRHPQSDDGGRRRPVQNVDEVAEQAALNDADIEEPGRDDPVDR